MIQRDFLGEQGHGESMDYPSMDPNHFPSRLHEMLCGVEGSGDGTIVSWQPHGKCFKVHDKEDFIAKVMPRWFCRLKFSTFERQLHKHGFRKLLGRGPDQGGYYHPEFVRELPEKAKTIHLTNARGKRGRKPQSKLTEPNFYGTGSSNLPGYNVASQGSLNAAARAPAPPSSLWSGRATSTSNGDIALANNETLETIRTPSGSVQRAGQSLQSEATLSSPSLPTSGRFNYAPTVQHDSFASQQQQQQQQQQLPSDLLRQRGHTAGGFGLGIRAPVPGVARQSSDLSLSSFDLDIVLEGLGASNQDDVADRRHSLAFPPAMAAAQPQPAFAASSQPQQPSQDYQQYLNELILRNQQQQRALQLQQQQLEQSRLELQLRGQEQRLDFNGGQHGMSHASLQDRTIAPNMSLSSTSEQQNLSEQVSQQQSQRFFQYQPSFEQGNLYFDSGGPSHQRVATNPGQQQFDQSQAPPQKKDPDQKDPYV